MQIRVIDSTKFMVAPLHPFFFNVNFDSDDRLYPWRFVPLSGGGLGKNGLFPREGQQNILFARVIVMTSMNKLHHIGYVGLSA